jgi:AcrR family transcriptional regulator
MAQYALHGLGMGSARAQSFQRGDDVTADPSATSTHAVHSPRSLTDKGRDRVAVILEEAKNILVEDGFSGLSFRAIAKRVGVTLGNIGYYYTIKDDLLVDLAEYIFDKWEARLQRHLPTDMDDPRQRFRYAIRYMIEQNRQPKTSLLLLEMWAMANRSGPVAKMMDRFYAKWRASIERIIAEINPSLPPHKTALRAALIATQIEGLMILIGPGKPEHHDLAGLEEEAVAAIEDLALRP